MNRDLRGHADTYRRCATSLIRTALVGFGVRQHARAGSRFPNVLSFNKGSGSGDRCTSKALDDVEVRRSLHAERSDVHRFMTELD